MQVTITVLPLTTVSEVNNILEYLSSETVITILYWQTSDSRTNVIITVTVGWFFIDIYCTCTCTCIYMYNTWHYYMQVTITVLPLTTVSEVNNILNVHVLHSITP